MHHDIQKVFSYHNFYLFFPRCKRKGFKLFQLLELFKKKVLMHRPSIKLVPESAHVYNYSCARVDIFKIRNLANNETSFGI